MTLPLELGAVVVLFDDGGDDCFLCLFLTLDGVGVDEQSLFQDLAHHVVHIFSSRLPSTALEPPFRSLLNIEHEYERSEGVVNAI